MLKTALQLYSIRDVLSSESFASIMCRLADMGYDGVELAGTYGLSAQDMKASVEAAGLTVVSAHIPFADMTAEPEFFAEYCDRIGCRQAAIPHMTRDYLPGGAYYAQTDTEIRKLARIFGSHGVVVAYHNHDFEFELLDGKALLDLIYEDYDPDTLQTQIDTCWVKVAGVDPVNYVRKYAGRCPTVHLKDFSGVKRGCPYALIGVEDSKPENAGAFEFRPCGYGVQNIGEIIRASEESGAKWLIVEQDEPSMGKSSLECAQMSIQYLKGLDK